MERARFGREAELARVSSFLDAVPNGPDALVLGGEAGIGKSAVWLDALGDARARSYRVLSSRPTESEAKLSFAAVGDLLDGVVDEVLDELPAPQRTALEVALLRAEAGASPPDRRSLSSAFHGALMTLATTGPLVLAIDDVHRPGCWSSRSGGCMTCRSGSSSRREPRRTTRSPWDSIERSQPSGYTDCSSVRSRKRRPATC